MENSFNSRLKSLEDLAEAFPTEQHCIDYLEERRWGGNVVSPFDPTSKVYKCKGNKYRCKNTGKYFNVKTKTIFSNSLLPLIYWFKAVWLYLSEEKISSIQLSKRIGVTQKTAWNMLRKIKKVISKESMENPIIDSRIVNDTTFALRFKNFIEKVNVCDQPSEEEKDYLLMVAEKLLKYQVKTAVDSKELHYLVMNKVIK